MEAATTKAVRVDTPSRRSTSVSSPGFWVGIELTLPDIPTPGSWVLRSVEARIDYFLREWGGFRVLTREYRALDGANAFVLLECVAADAAREELGRARMWWKGIPVFGARDERIVRRETYEDRAAAIADLGLRSDGPVDRLEVRQGRRLPRRGRCARLGPRRRAA